MKPLSTFLISLVVIAVMVYTATFTGCSNPVETSTVTTTQNPPVLTEQNFIDTNFYAVPGSVVILYLEAQHSPADTLHPDTDLIGTDVVRVRLPRTIVHTVQLNESCNFVLTIIDKLTGNILTELDPVNNLKTVTMTPGDYIIKIRSLTEYSAGTDIYQNIFFQPQRNAALNREGGYEQIDADTSAVRTLLATNSCSFCNLSSANLSNTNLSGANLSNARLISANLSNANLSNANLSYASLVSANFTGANLTNADLSGASGTGSNFTGANLTNANLSGVSGNGLNFTSARLRFAKLNNGNFPYSKFTSANLRRADLSNATFTRAAMRYVLLDTANLTGVDLSYADLESSNMSYANLQSANLSNTSLIRIVLKNTNFRRAKFTGCYFLTPYNSHLSYPAYSLEGTKFTGADFSNVHSIAGLNLVGAQLDSVNFTYANLSNTIMKYADCRYSDFGHANLTQANVVSAHIEGANFCNSNRAGILTGGSVYYNSTTLCWP